MIIRKWFDTFSILAGHLGVDVARFGADRTVLALFEGCTFKEFTVSSGRDLVWTARTIQALHKAAPFTRIAIDDTGVGGGVVDMLRASGLPIVAVNASSSPRGFVPYKQFTNSRAEMYFALEADLRSGAIQLQPDVELESELTAPRILFDEATGKYLLEPKSAIKARLGLSPDKADALALARYAWYSDNNRRNFFL